MELVNWTAVVVGAALSFGLGFLWFGPLFGRVWASGSHDIAPPAAPPALTMIVQALGTLALALVIGLTEVRQDLTAAVAAILAVALLQYAGALFSQKSRAAALVDGTFPLVMGLVMIVAQAML